MSDDMRNGGQKIAIVDEENIRSKIYTIRGRQVMLDSDLAELYGVETKNLNKAAGRNEDRFPESFRFRISNDEYKSLRFHFGTSNIQNDASSRGGRRYLPYAYTESGIAMLSAVLRSDTAVRVSVQIMEAFVAMRHFIADNAQMFDRINIMERRQIESEAETKLAIVDNRREIEELRNEVNANFERIFEYMSDHAESTQKIFFDGQVYDAFSFLTDLVRRAEKEIVLIDGYVDVGTLNILAKKSSGVSVTIYTRPQTKLSAEDTATFNAQYPTLAVKHTKAFHDRFLILDSKEAYLIGASLKDAGKKCFGVARIEDKRCIDDILTRL